MSRQELIEILQKMSEKVREYDAFWTTADQTYNPCVPYGNENTRESLPSKYYGGPCSISSFLKTVKNIMQTIDFKLIKSNEWVAIRELLSYFPPIDKDLYLAISGTTYRYLYYNYVKVYEKIKPMVEKGILKFYSIYYVIKTITEYKAADPTNRKLNLESIKSIINPNISQYCIVDFLFHIKTIKEAISILRTQEDEFIIEYARILVAELARLNIEYTKFGEFGVLCNEIYQDAVTNGRDDYYMLLRSILDIEMYHPCKEDLRERLEFEQCIAR